jgi:hypothetical protein
MPLKVITKLDEFIVGVNIQLIQKDPYLALGQAVCSRVCLNFDAHLAIPYP